MVEDKFLKKLKEYLRKFCKEFHLKIPDLDKMFTEVLKDKELIAAALIGSKELEDWIEKYDSFAKVNGQVEKQLGANIGAAPIEKEDVRKIKHLLSQAKHDSKKPLVKFIKQNDDMQGLLKNYYKKVDKYDMVGIIPYRPPNGFLEKRGDSYMQTYIHEGIHMILEQNKIDFRANALDEGLCVYLHKEFLGLRAGWFYFAGGARTKQYKRWAKFLKKYFKEIDIEPEDVPMHVKAQLKGLGRKQYRKKLVKMMKKGMGEDFEKELEYHEYA